MTRKPVVAVAFAFAAAALIWLVNQGGDAPDPGDDAGAAAGEENPEQVLPGGTPQRAPVAPDDAGVGPVTGDAEHDPAPADESVETAAHSGPVLRIRVYDRVSREPLEAFRFTWLQGGQRHTGAGENGVATLEVAPEPPGSLLVEARGYEPESREQLTAHPGSDGSELALFLAPLPELVGVEITVRDPRGEPVPRVQVDAWRLERADDAAQAPARAPLWARRATADDGVYRLPDLAPGIYRFRVLALDEDGSLLPLLPHRETVTFRGSEHLPLYADLRPGATLAIEVVDVAGTPAGPGTGIRVTLPDGSEGDVTWLVDKEGQRLAGQGGLPAEGTARASEPLPPGSCRLEFFTDGELRHTVRLELAPGEQRSERVVLPSRR